MSKASRRSYYAPGEESRCDYQYEPPSLEGSDGEFPRGANRSFPAESGEERLRWFDVEQDREEVVEVCSRNDAGALVMPAAFTTYIEFRAEEPTGAAVEATCNECWETFWVPPFRSASECPFCHARGSNIS